VAGNERFNGDNVHLASGDNLLIIPYNRDISERIDKAGWQRDYPALEFQSLDLAVPVPVCRDFVPYLVSGGEPLVLTTPNQTYRKWLCLAHSSMSFLNLDILEKEPIYKYI
jgi:hypothetical protein